jgi:hypothetical protein
VGGTTRRARIPKWNYWLDQVGGGTPVFFGKGAQGEDRKGDEMDTENEGNNILDSVAWSEHISLLP